MNPTQVHYDIADWAIAGNGLAQTGECLWFLNPYRPSCRRDFSL
jgi:N-acetylmuramoyl-L-alanine amidase